MGPVDFPVGKIAKGYTRSTARLQPKCGGYLLRFQGSAESERPQTVEQGAAKPEVT